MNWFHGFFENITLSQKKVHKIWIWSHEFLESISYLISVKMGLIHWRFLRMLRKWLLQNLDRHSWLRFIAGPIWNEGEKISFFSFFKNIVLLWNWFLQSSGKLIHNRTFYITIFYTEMLIQKFYLRSFFKK